MLIKQDVTKASQLTDFRNLPAGRSLVRGMDGTLQTVAEKNGVDVKLYGATGDGQANNTAAMASGSSTITVTGGAPFALTDLGKLITIETVGVSQFGTITGFNSATSVTVSFAASAAYPAGSLAAWGSNDTAALQAAANTGLPLFLPPGYYFINAPITNVNGVYGAGNNNFNANVPHCGINAASLAGAGTPLLSAIHGVAGASSDVFQDFSIRGGLRSAANEGEFTGTAGLHPGEYSNLFRISNVIVTGMTHGFFLRYTQNGSLQNCFGKNNHITGLLVDGCEYLRCRGNIWSDARRITATSTNLRVTGNSKDCHFDDLVDEAFGGAGRSSAWFGWCSECSLSGKVFISGGGYGVEIGRDARGATRRFRLSSHVQPYDGGGAPAPGSFLGTVIVGPEAEDTDLRAMTQDTMGGGTDVVDFGIRTKHPQLQSSLLLPSDPAFDLAVPSGYSYVQSDTGRLITRGDNGWHYSDGTAISQLPADGAENPAAHAGLKLRLEHPNRTGRQGVNGVQATRDGHLVGQWRDTSGSSSHVLAQSQRVSGRLRPETNGAASFWSIQFGRTFQPFYTRYDLPNLFGGMTQGHIFIVLKLDNDPPTGGQGGLWFGGADAAEPGYHPLQGSGIIYDNFGTTARKTVGNPTPSLSSTWRVYEVISTGAEWTAKLDGSTIFTTAVNTVAWPTLFTLGVGQADGNSWFIGRIAAVYLYSTAFATAAEASAFRTGYINPTFGTAAV